MKARQQRARLRCRTMRELIKEVESRGWTVAHNGHYKLRCPNTCRHLYVIGSSPSEYRAMANALAFLNNRTCVNRGVNPR